MEWEERDLDVLELEAWREATEVPDVAVAALQARVLAQVAQPRSRLPWWKWTVPVAALAVLVAVVATRPVVPPPVEPTAPKAPAVFIPLGATPAPEDALPPPAPAPLVSRRAPVRKPAFQEVSYIRYETPDPDVVILLIGSDGGGE